MLFLCLHPFPDLPESRLLSSWFWLWQVFPTQYKVCFTDNCCGLLLSVQRLPLFILLQYINITWLVFVGKVLLHQGLLCRVFLTQLIYNPFLTPQMMSIVNTYFRFIFPFPSPWFFSITSTLKFVFQMPSEWFPCLPSYYYLWRSSFLWFL